MSKPITVDVGKLSLVERLGQSRLAIIRAFTGINMHGIDMESLEDIIDNHDRISCNLLSLVALSGCSSHQKDYLNLQVLIQKDIDSFIKKANNFHQDCLKVEKLNAEHTTSN